MGHIYPTCPLLGDFTTFEWIKKGILHEKCMSNHKIYPPGDLLGWVVNKNWKTTKFVAKNCKLLNLLLKNWKTAREITKHNTCFRSSELMPSCTGLLTKCPLYEIPFYSLYLNGLFDQPTHGFNPNKQKLDLMFISA